MQRQHMGIMPNNLRYVQNQERAKKEQERAKKEPRKNHEKESQ